MDTIEIEVEGEKYRGHYVVEHGRLTVWTALYGHKVAELKGLEPTVLAQQLLREILGKKRPKP